MALHTSHFEGLAPAFIGVAEYDILYDECLHYAERLREAGTPVFVHVGKGMVHGSLRAMGVEEVERFYDELVKGIEGFLING